MMTIREAWFQEGWEKGFPKGFAKGKKKVLKKAYPELFKIGMSIKEIADMVELSENEVKQVILEAQSTQ